MIVGGTLLVFSQLIGWRRVWRRNVHRVDRFNTDDRALGTIFRRLFDPRSPYRNINFVICLATNLKAFCLTYDARLYCKAYDRSKHWSGLVSPISFGISGFYVHWLTCQKLTGPVIGDFRLKRSALLWSFQSSVLYRHRPIDLSIRP